MLESVSRRIDLPLLLAVFALVVIGLVFIYSATHLDVADPFAQLKRQLVMVVVGLVGMVVFALIDYRQLQGFAHLIYGLAIVMLLSVMVFGDERLGAQRWIDIGPIAIQPSEFAKIMIAVALAAFVADKFRDLSKPKDLLLTLFYVAVPAFLIFIQPDLGTSLVIAAATFGVLLLGGIRLKHFLVIAAGVMMVAFVAIKFHLLKTYQLTRLMVFLNPESDPTGVGYNLAQSQIAVGSGGFFGKGLLNGTQSTLNFLPHHDTDFIFAVIGEEWGFVGGLLVLALFAFMMFRVVQICINSRDMFGSLLAAAIGSMLFFQMTVNIGMGIGIMPITGLPLPFISFGGSSMIASLVSIGILTSIYMRRVV